MKVIKKIAIGLAIILGLLALVAVWYSYTYSMDEIQSKEVNTSEMPLKLLIASQGSEFKDAVTTNVINHYKLDSVYIKLIDLQFLSEIDAKDFDALLLIHTWENWKPPSEVKEFILGNKAHENKFIVLTTSGEGSYKMDEVDALTGESILNNASDYSDDIIEKIEKLFNAKTNRNHENNSPSN